MYVYYCRDPVWDQVDWSKIIFQNVMKKHSLWDLNTFTQKHHSMDTSASECCCRSDWWQFISQNFQIVCVLGPKCVSQSHWRTVFVSSVILQVWIFILSFPIIESCLVCRHLCLVSPLPWPHYKLLPVMWFVLFVPPVDLFTVYSDVGVSQIDIFEVS